MIEVTAPNGANFFYADLTPEHASALLHTHAKPRGLLRRATQLWQGALDTLLVDTERKPRRSRAPR